MHLPQMVLFSWSWNKTKIKLVVRHEGPIIICLQSKQLSTSNCYLLLALSYKNVEIWLMNLWKEVDFDHGCQRWTLIYKLMTGSRNWSGWYILGKSFFYRGIYTLDTKPSKSKHVSLYTLKVSNANKLLGSLWPPKRV